LNANLFILCGYNKILRSQILDLPKYKVINCHGGKLPEYRGVAPINWQIINGEEILGFSILYADEGIDTGAILKEHRFTIEINTNANDIVKQSIEWFPHQLESIVSSLEEKGRLESKEQDESAAVHYTRRYPEDSSIDWKHMIDLEVHNLVRALVDPYPNAFGYIDGDKIGIIETKVLDETYKGVPGTVVLKRNGGVIVNCKNRAILILKLRVDGQECLASDYLKIGKRFKYIG